MTQAFKDQMIGATRLVRSGKLAEATSLLQRTLRGEAGGAGPVSADTRAPVLPPPTLLDGQVMEPQPSPSKRHDTSWSGASFDFQSAFEGLSFNPFAQPSPIAHATGEAVHGGSFISQQFDSPAGSRPYKLYVPAAYNGTALPLVVMLHGCTQSPDDFAAGTRMNVLAEEQGFLVCYPAQTSSANSSKCWNWFSAADQHRDHGEPSIIAGITRAVMAQHAVDPRRVYVAGLSAGGALAATMGQAYPDLYAGVAVHSGLACGAATDMSSAFRVMRQGSAAQLVSAKTTVPAVPTIVFHGDRDTTVNPVNGDEVAAQILKGETLRTEIDDGQVPHGHSFKRTRYIDRNGRAVVEQWNIHGAGHAWAGGSSAGSYTDPQGPDASREMLRFFTDHVGTTTA